MPVASKSFVGVESGETKEDFGEDGRSAVDAVAEEGGEGCAQLRVRRAADVRDDEHRREGADGLSHAGRRRCHLRIHHLLRL